MFCKNCGAQNADGSKFCTSCGASCEVAQTENLYNANQTTQSIPQFVAPQPAKQRKKGGAKIVILIVSIIVLIIALAIGGFFAYKKFFDPSSKVLSALNAGDLDAALEHYDDVEEVSDELEKGLKKRLDKVYSDFLADKIKYEEAKDEINAIKKMKVTSLSSAIRDTGKKVDKLNDSRTAYKTAEAFMDEMNYEKAISNFKNVIEDDTNYKKAKEKLSECIEKYRDQVLTNAASYAETGDYTTAIALLADADKIIKNDTEINKQKALYEAELADKQLDDILAEAAEYAEDGDFPAAISTLDRALSALPDSAEISAKLEEYTTAYENEVLADVDELIEDGEYDEAEDLIYIALETLTDSQKLRDKLEEIEDSRPTPLHELTCIDSGSYEYKSEHLTDAFGFSYNDYYSYRYHDRDECGYSIFNLNKNYSSFNGSIVAFTDTASNLNFTIEIFLDGKLVYIVDEYTKTTGTIDFDIDVTNATKLEIRIKGHGGYRNENRFLAIVDAFLSK